MSAKRTRAELQPPRIGSESKPTPGMEAALRALSAPKRKPDEADAPPLSTFPKRPGAKQLPGQLRLGEGMPERVT